MTTTIFNNQSTFANCSALKHILPLQREGSSYGSEKDRNIGSGKGRDHREQ